MTSITCRSWKGISSRRSGRTSRRSATFRWATRPDGRGTLLAFGGGQLVEGDVEFHLRASDWVGHGHHGDPHYRSVVLHVVLDDDAAPPRDSAGQAVPTLVLALAEVARLIDGDGA